MKEKNVNKAPKGVTMTCKCGYSTKDKRKMRKHSCKE